MSEDMGTGPTREEELRGADAAGRRDEGSEWRRDREGRTGSEKQEVVDAGRVDETGSARDLTAPEEPETEEGLEES